MTTNEIPETTYKFAPHAHIFTVAGCKWQWAADHDDAECWAEFEKANKGRSK